MLAGFVVVYPTLLAFDYLVLPLADVTSCGSERAFAIPRGADPHRPCSVESVLAVEPLRVLLRCRVRPGPPIYPTQGDRASSTSAMRSSARSLLDCLVLAKREHVHPLVPRRVSKYEILREVGRGGMATVYLARQTDLDRLVALKQLEVLHDFRSGADVERFLREARVAAGLDHPNIVGLYEYVEQDGEAYIAMEYVEGGTLRPFVGRLTLAQVAGVLQGALDGLGYAHASGIVHGDVKPENVMVGAAGRVRIADFGIARALNEAIIATSPEAAQTVFGTPAYMAPEQAMVKDVHPATDLYALGVMAYEHFCGNVPFHDSEKPLGLLFRKVTEPVVCPLTCNPGLDPELAHWIEWLLQTEVGPRPSTALEAWEAFEEIVLRLLGPRWHRQARLLDLASHQPPDPAHRGHSGAGPAVGRRAAARGLRHDGSDSARATAGFQEVACHPDRHLARVAS